MFGAGAVQELRPAGVAEEHAAVRLVVLAHGFDVGVKRHVRHVLALEHLRDHLADPTISADDHVVGEISRFDRA